MKNCLSLLVLFLLLSSTPLLAKKHTISGYAEDVSFGERMVGVYVVARELSLGTTTNTFGFYSIPLPTSTFAFDISFIGYKKTCKLIDISESIHLNIAIESSALELNEIPLVGEESILQRAQSSVIDVLAKRQIKFQLSNISESYILYKKSRLLNNNADDFFAGEPIQIYTNVQNGLVVFVGKTLEEHLLEIV